MPLLLVRLGLARVPCYHVRRGSLGSSCPSLCPCFARYHLHEGRLGPCQEPRSLHEPWMTGHRAYRARDTAGKGLQC
eukprot:scaffold7381_cov310-Pinguiococcus_pyrenoidosus.AAC.116